METPELGCFAQLTGAQELRRESRGRGRVYRDTGTGRGAQSRLAAPQTLGSHTG